ncbi:DNA methyltransferase [Elizabethkingia anophelis]|uniref:DNA methyltransferase n=1 Tax=Elizabethkingia anophelis TaxID=1117645 RepID=UPI00200C1C8E|nr:DNA methyltransferase [Elizabethkingia anophelis]MCL1034970.1 site-specific DNA-methyltransferase [Elizabethkingia anophelis]
MSKSNAIINNKLNPKLRLNTICPYFTMFPLSFPYRVLQKTKKTDVVYDPFCGRGTTNFAARLLGLNSYGIDSNPIAHAVAQSKLQHVDQNQIYSRCVDILEEHDPIDIPQGDFWELAYHPNTLINICKLRNYFINEELLDDIDISLRALILGILHGPKMKTQPSYLSNQMPRTFSTKPNYSIQYWRKNMLMPSEVNLLDLVERRSKYIFNEHQLKKVDGAILLGDSRSLTNTFENKITRVITSPPYYGMSTYEQDQWLRNWFLGGSSQVDYTNQAQLKHGSESVFVNDLAKVWANTAPKCMPDAKLIIRFGALPSKSKKTPRELIKESLEIADCGWKISSIRSAGEPKSANRQANQFKGTTGNYVEEIDVYATLNI